jgi:hypothetical protein
MTDYEQSDGRRMLSLHLPTLFLFLRRVTLVCSETTGMNLPRLVTSSILSIAGLYRKTWCYPLTRHNLTTIPLYNPTTMMIHLFPSKGIDLNSPVLASGLRVRFSQIANRMGSRALATTRSDFTEIHQRHKRIRSRVAAPLPPGPTRFVYCKASLHARMESFLIVCLCPPRSRSQISCRQLGPCEQV